MIIDTGFNREDTKERMMEIFKELDLKPETLFFF